MDAAKFLQTLSDEVLDEQEYSDVSGISKRLASMEEAIACLEQSMSTSDLNELLYKPAAYDLIGLLTGTSAKWLRARSRAWVTRELAPWKTWLHGTSLRGVVVGLLLAEAQQSRSQRRRRKFEVLVRQALDESIDRSDPSLHLRAPMILGKGQNRRSFDYVIVDRQGPLVAVIDIFQTRAGGRQQYIFEGLPELQESLRQDGVQLLVVADGPGFRSMSYVVRRVAPRLAHFTNLSGIAEGELDTAITDAFRARAQGRPSDPGAEDELYKRLATLALKTGRSITPSLLRMSTSTFDPFVLRFRAANPYYALIQEGEFSWRLEASGRIQVIRELARPLRRIQRPDLIRIAKELGNHLDYHIDEYTTTSEYVLFGMRMLGIQLRIPDPLPIFVMPPSTSQSRRESFESVDRDLTQGRLVARMAVIIDIEHPDVSRQLSREFSTLNKSQLSVLSMDDLLDLLARDRANARDYFVRLILRDVDLSLVSPFISEGPTPENMFFGREPEIRRIVEQINRQSFALIGGRKAGKTSILQHLHRLLGARLFVDYLDCQAHPERGDFLRYLHGLTPSPIRAALPLDEASAEMIIRAYLKSKFGDKQGVLLMDEVDELFFGDSCADRHAHVLSRSLRSISQSRVASVVVTGERSLFELTSNPTSPHWNFCTPLRIGPLSDESGRRLLAEPLKPLGIDIRDDALRSAITATACHPNLLQYLGNLIVTDISGTRDLTSRVEMHKEVIERLTSTSEFRQRFTRTFWSQATVLEKLLSIELDSKTPCSMEELRDRMFQAGLVLRPTEMERALDFLELYSIARQVPGGYLFTSEAFDTYFGPLRASPIVDQWREDLR